MSVISPKDSDMFTAEHVIMECRSIVCEAIEGRRSEGLSRAQAEVARMFELSDRRTRAYWNNEVRMVPAHEADLIRDRRRAVLRRRQDRLNQELAAVQQLLETLG